MSRTTSLILALAWLAVSATAALASPWNQKQGHGQLIMQLSYYSTNSGFDLTRKPYVFGSNGQYSKWEINPYFEYGFTDSLTFIANLAVPFQSYRDDTIIRNSASLGDLGLGVRYRLLPEDSAFALAIQGLVDVPLYSANLNPAPGSGTFDVEVRLPVGQGFSVGGQHAFWAIEPAIRLRHMFGYPADEFRTDATLGIEFGRLMLMEQLFLIKGLGNGSLTTINLNPNIDPNYDLFKNELSLVYQISDGYRIQAGWINHFAGKNTGAGNAFVAAFWWEF